ncbi:integrase core domain-containing protein [Desulfoscipio gibsoniae]|uniref:Transposase n=1 Tax=Desulfoscipio gibsoniae DSM 7213 TaxID=767817 RepID=R4KM56_9FIRM|nr:integrase core domain-containing protein [Desulfoscipio gibsoniae]AGL03769.1 transposase [Desulfoscipio gibsoniae DSM 7213]
MDFEALFQYFKEWASDLYQNFVNLFKSHEQLRQENFMLRSQLALYDHDVKTGKRPKPKATPAFRQKMVLLSKRFARWKECLPTFKPKTVIKWHKTAFKLYWFKKSKRIGRPPISQEAIDIIKQMYEENPSLSPEKIREKLLLKNVTDAPSPNTIAKYLPSIRKPPTEKQIQSWKMFLKNHAPDTWGVDFFTAPTLMFKVLYVLVIINHGTRKIEHFSVTTNPNVFWLKQQFRNTTPYDHKPKYLVHDNDAVFTSKDFQCFLAASRIKSKRTAIKAPWQNPYAERVIGTLRQELLNHIIPFNERHLHYLLSEYVHKYYNPHRTHLGLDGQTPIPTQKYESTTAAETKLKSTPVLGGLYHTYEKEVA